MNLNKLKQQQYIWPTTTGNNKEKDQAKCSQARLMNILQQQMQNGSNKAQISCKGQARHQDN